jgi:serine/threonine protein phosphatase 1
MLLPMVHRNSSARASDAVREAYNRNYPPVRFVTTMVLSRLFNRVRPDRASAPTVPAGQRVYAIGDIHGRRDLFDALLTMIEADDAARDPAQTRLILLGDLVDRGPDSRGVIDRAIALQGGPFGMRWLTGNHEEVFALALDGDAQRVRYCIGIGGDATIRSYGLDGDAYDRADFAEVARLLPSLVPDAHRAFLATGEDMIVIGDYAFVHAGVRPGVALDRQTQADLRWIRDSFTRDGSDHGKVVVHGHTITDQVEERTNRIGIDTGAYSSGRLTAIGVEGDQRWFLATTEGDAVMAAGERATVRL